MRYFVKPVKDKMITFCVLDVGQVSKNLVHTNFLHIIIIVNHYIHHHDDEEGVAVGSRLI